MGRPALAAIQNAVVAKDLGERRPEVELGSYLVSVAGDCALMLRHVAARLHPCDAVCELAVRLNGDTQIGELVSDERIVKDGLAVELGFLEQVDESLKDADVADGALGACSLKVEGRHGSVPAAIDLTEDVLLGDADAVHEDLAPAPSTHHVVKGAQRQAVRASALLVLEVHEKVCDPPVLGGLGVSSHKDVVPVGEVGAGRPYLLAGDDEIVAVLNRSGLE